MVQVDHLYMWLVYSTVAGQGVPSCGLWSVGHSLHAFFFLFFSFCQMSLKLITTPSVQIS